MTKKKVQRIKLQLDGNALKLDATLLELTPDGKEMLVEFDGPIPTTRLFRWTDSIFVNRKLGPRESPAQFPEIQMWKIV